MAWSEFHVGPDATSQQFEKYKDLYLKQLGIRVAKRADEQDFKRRLVDLTGDDEGGEVPGSSKDEEKVSNDRAALNAAYRQASHAA